MAKAPAELGLCHWQHLVGLMLDLFTVMVLFLPRRSFVGQPTSFSHNTPAAEERRTTRDGRSTTEPKFQSVSRGEKAAIKLAR